MPIPFSAVREKTLIEAKQFLYQHPFNTEHAYDLEVTVIELIRSLVKEYEAHLSLATRHLVASIVNGDCVQSVSPIG